MECLLSMDLSLQMYCNIDTVPSISATSYLSQKTFFSFKHPITEILFLQSKILNS